MNNKFKLGAIIVTGLITLGITSAIAKSTPSNDKNNKSFGDWKIVCEKNNNTKKEACLLQQDISATQEKKLIPVAAYQFIYNKEKDELKLLEILPMGFLLQPGTSIIVDDKIIANAKFNVCQNNACMAVADISKKDLKIILSKESAFVGMFNQEGKQANLPFSSKGLKEGLDALKAIK